MSRRLLMLRAAVVVVCAVILVRLVQLQMVEGERNRQLADENRIRIARRLAPRGNIYDRKDRLLASSRLAFSVSVIPEELALAGGGDACARLAELMELPSEEVGATLGRPRHLRYEPAVVFGDADQRVVARLEEHSVYLSGVSVRSDAVRYYPQGRLAAHVLGYVRQISAEELARPENEGYRPHDLIGKAGIERVAEHFLRGTDGGDQIEVDARGRRVRTLGTVAPRPGRDVWLTLDLELQRAAETALGDRPGAVVALNPKDGAILAMASHPSYDPNAFVGALSPAAWQEMTGPDYPQQNRATMSRYPPGSLFKIVTAAAALEASACDTESVFRCDGAYRIGRWSLRCWKREGHGTIGFFRGFAQSCNVMFATLGRRVGPERLADMARRFGLGQKSSVDLPEEAAGLVPTPQWKRKARREPWYPGDTCQMAIGQGDCLMTPLQAAVEVAVVASGGRLVRPHLLARVEGEEELGRPAGASSVGLRPETMAALRAGMDGVVARGGTAARIATERYGIAGKTGTAEAPSGEPHAWFAGYAPTDDPEIVVAVIVEHGGHGSTVAAPIARYLFDTALLPEEERSPWPPEWMKIAGLPEPEA